MCVILMQPEVDLEAQAKAMFAEYGPVYPGWVVTCHHNDILTYVGPDETGDGAQDLTIGLLGREKRDMTPMS